MNRIRKYKNKWQVLVTPYQQYNTSFEVLIGFWIDEHINNYCIEEFETLNDAQAKAFQMPDIEWVKIVIMYKNAYHDLKKIIKQELDKNEFIVDFDSTFMDPTMAKNAMFNRVMNLGKRFTLVNDMNDIISYNIINPWTKNINEIASILSKNNKLKIFKKYINNGIIHLIGQTDFGTTYEIVIWPTLLSNWAKWVEKHPSLSIEIKKNTFIKMVEMQKYIDSADIIR